MSQKGKVAIGFSNFIVADATVTNGAYVFSDPLDFARAVELSISPDSATDSSDFQADDHTVESEGGDTFSGGTLNLTADECNLAAKRFAFGLPAAAENGEIAYGNSQRIPYIACGYLVKWLCEGVKSWTYVIHPRIKFNQREQNFKTQPAGSVEYNTSSYTAKIFRGRDTNENWKIALEDEDYDTEAGAYAALMSRLGYVAPTP